MPAGRPQRSLRSEERISNDSDDDAPAPELAHFYRVSKQQKRFNEAATRSWFRSPALQSHAYVDPPDLVRSGWTQWDMMAAAMTRLSWLCTSVSGYVGTCVCPERN